MEFELPQPVTEIWNSEAEGLEKGDILMKWKGNRREPFSYEIDVGEVNRRVNSENDDSMVDECIRILQYITVHSGTRQST